MSEHADALTQTLADILRHHFAEARERVPRVYREHLATARPIWQRHWTHRRDVPADLLALPRLLWRQGRRLLRRPAPHPPALTGKEQALLGILREDLLDLPGLQRQLEVALAQASADLADCEALLARQAAAGRLPELEGWLQRQIERHSGPREGTRDLLVFLLVGLAARSGGLDVTFGSAIAAGSAAATAVYLSSQSWWGSLWIHLTGIPGWVSVAGALGGATAGLLLAPLVAPFGEWVVNRWRGEHYLRDIVDRTETSLLETRHDGLDFLGQLAALTQFAPDLLALLRSWR